MHLERIHVYRLIEPLHRGAPGRVWRARFDGTGGTAPVAPGTDVTLRVLDRSDVDDACSLARLDVVHRAARRISGPAVLAPIDHGLISGARPMFWSASPWVEGRTLADLLVANDIVPDLLLEAIVYRLAEGLVAAHAAGVVGLGLSPETVVLAEGGAAMVGDPGFGPVCGFRWPAVGLPPASMMCAAPEVLRGAPPTPASDLFSLGCIVYRSMTGAWHRPEDAEVLRLRADEMDAQRPDINRTQCSLFLSEVAHALLAADPEDRIATAAGLLSILRDRRSGAWWQALGARGEDVGGEEAASGEEGSRTEILDGGAPAPAPEPTAPNELPPLPIPSPAAPPDEAWWAVRLVPSEPAARHAAACVGRERELAVLDAALAGARAGEGRVVLLEGAAGSGKTRAVDAMLARFEALPEGERPIFLCGEHRSAGIGRPLGAVTEALTRWLGRSRVVEATDVAPLLGESAGIASAFAALLSSDAPPAGAAPLADESVPGAYLRCLETLAGRAPVVLVVENLQWADPEALDLFVFAARSASDLRLLVVGTHRPVGDVGEPAQSLAMLRRLPNVESLALGPLDAAAFGALAASVVEPPSAAAELAARVHAISGGLPATLLETIAVFECEGVLARTEDGRLAATPACAAATPPAGLPEAAARRLAGITIDEDALLAAASIQGVAFDADVARSAAGLDDERAAEAIRRLRRAGMLHPADGALRFGSETLFDTVAGRLDAVAAAARHTATASAFLESRNPEQLPPSCIHGVLAFRAAWHFLAGGQATRGLLFVGAAVEHLRRTCRHGDGERLLDLAQRAAHASPVHASERTELLLERSRCLCAQGRFDEQRETLELALGAARERRDLRRESRVLLDLASAPGVLEKPGQSDNFAKQALACAHRVGETEVEMRAHVAFARTALRQGRVQDARAHFTEAREIASARGDAAALAEIDQGTGLAAQASGAADHAEAAYRDALGQHRARGNLAGEAETLACLGHLAAGSGALPEAEALLRHALKIHVALGDGRGEFRVLGLLAMVLQESGHLVEAREAHGECLRRARRLDVPANVAVALLNVATVDAFLGRIEDARASYGEALRFAIAVSDVRLQGYALTGLAEVARQTGQLQVARDLVDRAMQRFRNSLDPSGLAAALLASGRVATLAGDSRTAKGHLFEAHRLAEQQGARQVLALAAALLGLLAARAGDTETAERRAIQAGIEIADLRASDATRIEILLLHALMLRVLSRGSEADRKLLHAETALLQSVHALPDDDRENVLGRLSPHREIVAGAAAARAAAPLRAPSPSDTVQIEAGAC